MFHVAVKYLLVSPAARLRNPVVGPGQYSYESHGACCMLHVKVRVRVNAFRVYRQPTYPSTQFPLHGMGWPAGIAYDGYDALA